MKNDFPKAGRSAGLNDGAVIQVLRQAGIDVRTRNPDIGHFGQPSERNPIINMNSNNNAPELIVSGIHLPLTPSLKTFVREKSDRLFRHQERIIRLRVELECDSKQAVSNRFTAKGHIEIHGPDMNASVSSDECHKAISLLVDKLDRMLNKRAKSYKSRRHANEPIRVPPVLQT